MKRIATIITALLILFSILSWVQNSCFGTRVSRSRPYDEVLFSSSDGAFIIAWGKRYQGNPKILGWRMEQKSDAEDWSRISGMEGSIGGDGLGFLWGEARGIDWRVLVCPAWLPSAIFSLPIAWIMMQRYRIFQKERLSRKRHACPACGYDLRATPDRCPECGAIKN